MGINTTVFFWGVVGGLLAEFIKWYNLRESPSLPEYRKSVFYWVITLGMIALGGLLAVIYNIGPADKLLAVNVGASAPLIIQTLMKTLPPGTSGRSLEMKGRGGSLFRFLRGE